MAGTAVRGGVADAHTLHAARIVGRDGLTLDAHRDLRSPPLFGRPRRPLRQLVADPLPQGDFAEELHHRIRITPGEAIHKAPLSGLHSHGEGIAGLDSVQAEVIAAVDHGHDGVNVTRIAHRSKGPGRLILHALHVKAGVFPLGDVHLFLAGHRAAEAGRSPHQYGISYRLPTDGICLSEIGALGIA